MSKKAIQTGKSLIKQEKYSTLAEMCVYISKKYPEKGMTFINAKGDEDFLSYPQLVEKAQKYLKGLYQKGLKHGDKLIIIVEDSKEFYISFWACIFGGIIAVPVSQPTSWEVGSTGLERLTKIWNELDKAVVLIEEENREGYGSLQKSIVFDGFKFISTKELLSNEKAEIYKSTPNDIIHLQFSSGSTGSPKGVQLTNKNILSSVTGTVQYCGLTSDDIVFTWLPQTHNMGVFGPYMLGMNSGSNVMILAASTFVSSPDIYLKKITLHKGTWICCSNFAFDWMVEKVPDEMLSELDLSSLRIAFNGSEPISSEVVNRFLNKFSKYGFKDGVILPAYGMSESTLAITIHPPNTSNKFEKISRQELLKNNKAVKAYLNNSKDIIEFANIGKPINGVSIRIADEKGDILNENEIGEIQAKGEIVTSGYYNSKEKNEELFVDGWLRTGDLGYITDGTLVITGRMKDILIIRGENYIVHDLEEIIYKLNVVNRGAIAFIGNFNARTQEEELLLFIQSKFEIDNFIKLRQIAINAIQSSLGIKISHVIPIDKIPKTGSGKIHRFKLKKDYEDMLYENIIEQINNQIQCTIIPEKVIHLPQNDLEDFLRKSWSELLKIPVDKISVEDSFMELGGNSVMSYQLLGKMQKYLNRPLGPEIFIKCKTISQISEYIDLLPNKKETLTENWEKDTDIDLNNSIAITGMAIRLPKAKNKEEFWNNLCCKRDCISKVSSRRKELSNKPDWDEWMGELDNVDYFDNEFFEISLEESIFMDPQQRLTMEVAYEALEDAGVITNNEDPLNVGVYAGINSNTYYQLVIDSLEQIGVSNISPKTMVNNLLNIVAARISHQYNFTGPALALDTACSSFLVSLHYAVSDLKNKNISGAVVIGSNIVNNPIVHLLSHKAGILSSSNKSKVFDKEADGSIIGEGVTVYYLEKLSDAIKGNKNIYGIVRGTAINNDGYSLGIMAPNPKGQFNVLLDAYKNAKISPTEISYIEAHGTGTTIGDPIEVNALSKLFLEYNDKKADKSIGIGSVKTNIGHLLPAAGGAGLAKVLLCLKNKKLVPSINMENINPALQLEKTPFRVILEVEDWTLTDEKNRKAGLSSLGLGGTNSHVILQEWNSEEEVKEDNNVKLLTFSAKTENALNEIIENTFNFIRNNSEVNINNLCFTRNRYRKHYNYRAACLVKPNNREITNIIKGNYLKKLSSNTLIVIGDLKNYKLDINNLENMKNEYYAKTYLYVKDIVQRNNIMDLSNFDENLLDKFIYYYALIKNLKDYSLSNIKIMGIELGNILADILNEEINLEKALSLLFDNVKFDRVNLEENSKISKADIILTVGIHNDELFKYIQENMKLNGILTSLEKDLEGDYHINLISAIQHLYIYGTNFNWIKIYADGFGKIISLPSYPFQEKSIWINQLKGENLK